MRQHSYRIWDGRKMLDDSAGIVWCMGKWFLSGRDFEDWMPYSGPVMQFTGPKDKNGAEVYEGDIVSDHNGVGVVEYVERHAAFRVNYKGNNQAKWFYDYNLKGEMESIEVIGNIHENPELLEQSNEK